MIDLMHENQMLKDSLFESRKQLDKIKRTIKFTQINELKIENKVLNEELLRLRKVIESELPTLSPKNSKSLSKISEIDEENSNLKEKIEELEKQINEFQVKVNIQSIREEEYALLQESMSKNSTQLNELKTLIDSLKSIIKEKDLSIVKLNKKLNATPTTDTSAQGFSRMKSMAAKIIPTETK
jgi:chromosome segregation ATPase